MMGLTARQEEVLELLMLGMSTDDIARKLWITKTTVRNHIQAIFDRIGVHTRVAAIHAAHVWVDSPEQRIIDWCKSQRIHLSTYEEMRIRRIFERAPISDLESHTVAGPWAITTSFTNSGGL